MEKRIKDSPIFWIGLLLAEVIVLSLFIGIVPALIVFLGVYSAVWKSHRGVIIAHLPEPTITPLSVTRPSVPLDLYLARFDVSIKREELEEWARESRYALSGRQLVAFFPAKYRKS